MIIKNATSDYASSKATVKNCDVYGRQWGIVTPTFGQTEIDGGTYTSTNHMAYISGSADVKNARFYITNRDKYEGLKLDYAYGFYCGSNACPENAVVNINNCEINNGNTRAESGIVAQRNYGYTAPKEINITDTDLYCGWRGIYFNSPNSNNPSTTKFNLYGDTKLYDAKGILITKEQLASSISSWKTKMMGGHSSYPCATTTGAKTTTNTYIIVGEGYADENKIVSAYATDDCNVYDYR